MSVGLEDVRVFVAVVRAGSLTAGGRELGIPKSTVSRRLAELEGALGQRLLTRSTRRMALTDAGRRYYERCARALEELGEAERELRVGGAEPRGRLRIAAPAELTTALLGAAVAQAARLHRQLSIELCELDRSVDLEAEGFDLALSLGALVEGPTARPLGELAWGLWASASYLERCGDPGGPAELADHELILGPGPSGVIAEAWELRGPRRVERVEVSGRLRLNRLALVLEAAREGLGIAALPMVVAQPWSEDELSRVLPRWALPPTELTLRSPERGLSLAARAFVGQLEPQFSC